MDRYDVVVIGAGPAGSAAAYHASRGGLRVLVTDRAQFPREKTCGDALVPAAIRSLTRMGITDLRGHLARGLKVIHLPSGTERIEGFGEQGPPYAGFMVPRTVLDDALLTRARASGAKFVHARARRVVARGREQVVFLDADDGAKAVVARTVVLATGSGSLTGLVEGAPALRREVWGLAGRAYLDLLEPPGDLLEVYVPVTQNGRVRSGFAWIFPVGGVRVNVGVGMFRPSGSGSGGVAALVHAFIADRCASDPRFRGAVPGGPVRSASIAVGPDLLHLPGLLAVGDCAGLAHGLTGEGIAPALESGELAAAAILERPDDPATAYRARVEEILPRQFRLAPALRDLHSHPYLAVGRGWDLFGRSHRTSGRALRQLVWDARQGDPPICEHLDHRGGRDAVREVAQVIVRGVQHLRPLLGELVTYQIAQPDSEFGWYATFGALVRGELCPHLPSLPAETVRILAILETVELVSALHDDLLPVGEDGSGSSTWGRNTLNLVLADCLTARALQALYALDAGKMHHVSRVTSRLLRRRAEARAGSAVAGADQLRDVFAAAARAALPDDACPALRLRLTRAATIIARARESGAGQVAWPRTLARVRASLRDDGDRNSSPSAPEPAHV